MQADNFIRNLIMPSANPARTKEIFNYNPTVKPVNEEKKDSVICVYNYDQASIEKLQPEHIHETYGFVNSEKVSWINLDGLCKDDVEAVCQHFGIHNLLVEDILSVGQRPKMDDIEGILFCLLNMLYFNNTKCSVEQEQISIVLGKNFVITFQDDATRDVFNTIRQKLFLPGSKIRQRGADYLCYNLIDVIVDHYFEVMENLGAKIEELEDEITYKSNKKSLAQLNRLRKELIVLKRTVSPIRDLVNGLIKSESDLIDENLTKYFKDVYDHISQANEDVENYRDIMTNMQDLYINQVNLKMNEVMKVLAIVTCLLAPATVIGGIFGMNFDIIPIAHQEWGFYITVGVMLVVPLIMLTIFKKRGWF